MQMTKELEKRLKLMRCFNQVLGDRRYTRAKIYNDKIFVHIEFYPDRHISTCKVGDYIIRIYTL